MSRVRVGRRSGTGTGAGTLVVDVLGACPLVWLLDLVRGLGTGLGLVGAGAIGGYEC